MIYFAMRPFARLALKVFFKKITLSHTDRIPRDKPVVLASNHPTAFMEPCVLACFLDQSLYFLVRGDIFAKPVYAKMLRAFHMLPMYRLKDRGYKFVKANFQTFDACFDALYENKTIMILAEGNTKSEKRLRPLQKGTARLAFGSIDKNPAIEDVYVVPVGVNFTYMDRFRAEVMVDFAEAISARSYYETYCANNNEAIDAFTGDLSQQMRKLLVHVDREDDDALAERLLVMSRSARQMQLWRVTGDDPSFLEEEKAVAAFVNTLPDAPKKELEETTELYFGKLEKKRLSDRAVLEQRKNALLETLLMSIGAPVFLAGYLFNYLPARAAKAIADKEVNHIEFYAPVMLVVALVLFKIYYAVFLVIGIVHLGWLGVLAVVLMALAGYFSVLYRDTFQLWKHRHNWGKLDAADKEKMVALRSGIELMRQNAQ
jgi:glycerol-3-phosphate O-acyltransferase / dihydroxyacetone phosphate acyltransferase